MSLKEKFEVIRGWSITFIGLLIIVSLFTVKIGLGFDPVLIIGMGMMLFGFIFWYACVSCYEKFGTIAPAEIVWDDEK